MPSGSHRVAENELLAVFNLYDKDKSGSINAKELPQVLRAIGLNPTQKQCQDLVNKYGGNDAELNFAEMLNLVEMEDCGVSCATSELKAAFKLFDKDGDGFVTLDELKDALKTKGEPLSDEEVRNMFAGADKNNDGKLCIEELVQLLRGDLSCCPKGHKLERFTEAKWACDVCRGKYPTKSSGHGCRPCNYTVCLRCYEGAPPDGVHCPNGHELTSFHDARWNCDMCGARFSASSADGFGCRPCDYSVCPNCFRGAPKESQQSQRSTNVAVAGIAEDNDKRKMCPNGHLLVQRRAIHWRCDQCGKDHSSVETAFACRQCDYDLCAACAGHPEAPQRARNSSPDPEPLLMPKQLEDCDQLPNTMRQKGNQSFRQHNADWAVTLYTKALEEDIQSVDLRVILLSNCGIGQLALDQFEAALQSGKAAASFKANWWKPFAVQAIALEGLMRYEEALDKFKESLRVNEERRKEKNAPAVLALIPRASFAPSTPRNEMEIHVKALVDIIEQRKVLAKQRNKQHRLPSEKKKIDKQATSPKAATCESVLKKFSTTTEKLEDRECKYIYSVSDAQILVDEVTKHCQETNTVFQDVQFAVTNPATLNAEPAGGNVLDPVEWLRPKDFADAPALFLNSIAATDIHQGYVGDCWFCSALSALGTRPKIVEALFYPPYFNPTGIYSIKVFLNRKWKALIVDDFFPTRNGKLCFVSGESSNELWVPLLEKAMSKLIGSYQRMHAAFCMGVPLQLFSGAERSQFMDMGPNWEPEELYNTIANHLKEGHLIACATNDQVISTVGHKGGVVDEEGLVLGHAYSVLSSLKVGEHRLVQVRNTWGFQEWNGAWSDNSEMWQKYPEVAKACKYRKEEQANDGLFWISVNDFSMHFNYMIICYTKEGGLDPKMQLETICLDVD